MSHSMLQPNQNKTKLIVITSLSKIVKCGHIFCDMVKINEIELKINWNM